MRARSRDKKGLFQGVSLILPKLEQPHLPAEVPTQAKGGLA